MTTFLDLSKFKEFAYDKLNLTRKLKFVLDRLENVVGKGENAGYQYFLLFPQFLYPRVKDRGHVIFTVAVIILDCAIGANLWPMAHENMTYGPKWPLKILDGAKFYPDCAEINNVIFQISIQAYCKKFSEVNIYTRTILSKLYSKVCLSFNLMHEIINKVSYQLFDAYLAKI